MTNPWQGLRFRRDHRWAPGRVSAYLDGELAARSRARLQRHVGDCPDCLGVLRSLDRMLGLMRSVAPRDPGETPDIALAVRRRLHEPSSG